jgi:hypothetical protein
MKGASEMNKTRWTLGVVLAATVSLWGLVEADASPFSSYILSDDLGNMVRGSAAEASPWDEGSGSEDTEGSADSGDTNNGGADSGGSASGGGDSGGASSTGESASGGTENDGHGNNTDGVDSSNKGNSKTGEDTNCDADGICVDDEIKTNNGKKK